MKFSKLEIGRVFDYQGNRFTKSGPLQAEDMATGEARTILQAASVQPVDTATLGTNKPQQALAAQLGHVRTLLDVYHQSAISLADSCDQEIQREELKASYRALVEAIDQLSQQICSG
ncbi:MAG: hypothetical protein OQL28_07380 [Sedimenticola sp.]|nr:hypothetical protein [Sedimenticola sp.]